MKFLFCLGLIILFSNCSTNGSQPVSSSDPFTGDTSRLIQTERVQLTYPIALGMWRNCQTTTNGITKRETLCNTISFQRDGTAIVVYPSGKEQKLNWKLSKNTLELKTSGGSAGYEINALNDTIYETVLTITRLGYQLDLSARRKGCIYTLSKSFDQ